MERNYAANGGIDAASVSENLTPVLGWFSLGLGMTEVTAPRAVARSIGIDEDKAGLVQLCGVREILSGLGILSGKPDTQTALWSRVAGDAIDLMLLGTAGGKRRDGRTGMAAAAVLGVSALDALCAMYAPHNGTQPQRHLPLRAHEVIAINRPKDELYGFWRNFENLPRIMSHLESVQVIGDRRSRWVARPIQATRLEWEVELTDDTPGEVIGWRSVPGGDIDTTGSVRFETLPGDRGTNVKVTMHFALTRSRLERLARPILETIVAHDIHRDLRKFKQFMETGEIATTRGQPAGRARGQTILDRIGSQG